MELAPPLHCEVEYQEADAASGRNRMTLLCPKTALVRRRSGVEVVSQSPPLRKAIRLRDGDRYEVYFRFARDGKAAFIRRDATRVYQFNIRHADPRELVALVRFCIRLGAVAKSPLASLSETSTAPPIQQSAVSLKRSRATDREPLQDRSNLPERVTQAKRQRHGTSALAIQPSQALTADQRRVIQLISAGRNIFFTGSAGTGKSFLLQQILAPNGPLRDFVRDKRVFATATTGIAAYNIGGMTLHHFAGLDPRSHTSDVAQLVAQIKRKKDAIQRWRSVDLLVIDEVSMLDGCLFDLLEELARQLRPEARHAFFGGIQLVLSGDFFQLPPVGSRNEGDSTTLCFESDAWQRGVREVIELKQVFRQTNTEFINILNALRVGNPTRAMIERLNEQCKELDADSSDAIRIFTHNNDVLQTNNKRLDELAGRKFNYVAADTGRKDYLSACPAPQTLALKKNAYVMLIKSINPASGLVNGCRGVVVAFTPQTNLPVVQFSNGSTEIVQHEDFPIRIADTILATRRQLPLALAWAISIHKSQGLAFPAAVVDLSRVFEYGQAYVALSRVRSIDRLILRRRLDERRLILADKRVLRFYDQIRANTAD